MVFGRVSLPSFRVALSRTITRFFCIRPVNWVFRTNVTGDFGIVTEDFGPS